MDSGVAGTLTDGVVRLRAWEPADAGWYASAALDPMIQRFTSEPGNRPPFGCDRASNRAGPRAPVRRIFSG